MMKTLYIKLLIVLLAVCAGSCRTNNGDIGVLYGLWHVAKIDFGVQPCEMDKYYFRFQNNIVVLTYLAGDHQNISSFGNWTRSDDKLMLDFSNSLDTFGNPLPVAPLIGLASNMLTFDIHSESSKKLVLWYYPNDHVRYTYTLEKVN